MDAFIDESYNEQVGRYCIGAVIVPHDRILAVLPAIHGFMDGKRFKWARAKPQQRSDFIDRILIPHAMECVGAVGSVPNPREQNRVRASLVRRLLPHLHARGVVRATFDQRWPEVDSMDLEVARELAVDNRLPVAPSFEVQHLPEEACWLIWCADAVAGALHREATGDVAFTAQLGALLTQLP